MVTARKKQAGQPMLIRFSDGSDLRERLEERAKSSNRSLTAEILHRLETSLGDATVLPTENLHDMIITDLNEKLEAAWERLDWLDDHFKLDSRPEWLKAKPTLKRR